MDVYNVTKGIMADDTIRECRRCDATNWTNGRRCHNRTCKYGIFCWVHHKYLLNLAVKPSGLPNAGNGLFVYDPVPAGTRIAEYTGKEVDAIEYDRREEGAYGYKLEPPNDDVVIDAASTQSSVARYANDCRDDQEAQNLCETNAEFVEDDTGNDVKVFLEATQNIPAGGEVFLDYGPEYWDGE